LGNKIDKKLGKSWTSLTIALCVAILFYVIISHLGAIGSVFARIGYFIYPVFLGAVIAYIFDPLVKVFEFHVFQKIGRYRVRRGLSVLCAIVLVLAGLVFLIVSLIPQIVDSITTLISNIGVYAENIRTWFNSLAETAASHNVDISGLQDRVTSALDSVLNALPQDPSTIVNSAVSVGKNVASWVIGFIIAIYFLLDKVRLQKWFARLFRACVKEKTYQESAAFWKRCNDILIRFLVCDLLDALIVGVANAIFMSIARMPYIVLISVVVGVTNLAPTFGPIVGAVIGAFILVLQNPWYALWFLIFTIILQTFDGYVLKPKMFGSLLGVSGVWILICIVVGGRIFGVPGVLLAIPFAAIMDFVYKEFILVKLDERKARREAADREAAEKSGETADDGQAEENLNAEADAKVNA
jgi:predicted PurR-regulated permease PerM